MNFSLTTFLNIVLCFLFRNRVYIADAPAAFKTWWGSVYIVGKICPIILRYKVHTYVPKLGGDQFSCPHEGHFIQQSRRANLWANL